MGKRPSMGMEIKNRRSSWEYEFIETEIVGIKLEGSEVKSIKAGNAGIAESHCYISDGELWIAGMYVAERKESGRSNHEPLRKRKLLMTRKQINKWDKQLATKGLTIATCKLFVDNRGYIKLKIALAKGKKTHDKRNSIKEKDIKRDMDREIKG